MQERIYAVDTHGATDAGTKRANLPPVHALASYWAIGEEHERRPVSSRAFREMSALAGHVNVKQGFIGEPGVRRLATMTGCSERTAQLGIGELLHHGPTEAGKPCVWWTEKGQPCEASHPFAPIARQLRGQHAAPLYWFKQALFESAAIGYEVGDYPRLAGDIRAALTDQGWRKRHPWIFSGVNASEAGVQVSAVSGEGLSTPGVKDPAPKLEKGTNEGTNEEELDEPSSFPSNEPTATVTAAVPSVVIRDAGRAAPATLAGDLAAELAGATGVDLGAAAFARALSAGHKAADMRHVVSGLASRAEAVGWVLEKESEPTWFRNRLRKLFTDDETLTATIAKLRPAPRGASGAEIARAARLRWREYDDEQLRALSDDEWLAAMPAAA